MNYEPIIRTVNDPNSLGKIASVHIDIIRLPANKAYNMAGQSYGGMNYHGLLCRIRTRDGVEGVSEAFMTPGWYGAETPLSYIFLIRKIFGPIIIGESVFNTAKIHAKMDNIWKMGNNWSKSLIDNALHDAAAKTLNRPITEIIGGTVRTSFPISAGIGTESPEAMAKSALEYVQKGFKTIKLKIGEVDNIQLDIDRVKEVRAAVGDNILIRVDANGVYSVPQAIKVINKMEKYDLDHVEQPVADRNFEGMAQIRSKICTPLMADESVHTLKDAYDIIKLGAADVIKLKMVKNGGYRRCQEIAALCHSEGIEVVLGNGYNSSAAAIAELSLACSSNHISPAGEFCGPDKLTSDILLNPMVVENGNAILPKGAGIGSDIDYEVFNKSILDPKYLIK